MKAKTRPNRASLIVHLRGRHGPAWRFCVALALAGTLGCPLVADVITQQVARYLRLLQSGGKSGPMAARAFPAIHRAFQIYRDTPLHDSLRTMVLGQLREAEILHRSGLTAANFRHWREIFFAVDLQKDSLSWHVLQVIGRELDAGNLELGVRLHLARVGGPVITRQLLDGPGTPPEDPREYGRWMRTQAQIKSLTLLMTPCQSRAEFQVFQKLALNFHLKERQAALQEQQLANRVARQERRDESRRQSAEQKAAAAAARAQARADREAKELELGRWHDEQRSKLAERQEADMRERIVTSPLSHLAWGRAQKSTSAAGLATAAAAPLPKQPVPSRQAASPPITPRPSPQCGPAKALGRAPKRSQGCMMAKFEHQAREPVGSF